MSRRSVVSARRPRVQLVTVLAAIVILLASIRPVAAADFSVVPDFPIPNGHFYSQASGEGSAAGFAVVNDSGAQFYREFTRLGGVSALGYPSSRRFIYGGFVTQATQKYLLQWRPELQRAEPANVFDIFSERGLDPILAQNDLIPPTPDNLADRGRSWPEIVARHLAILDQNPTIRARYFADPDPIADFGLPQAAADYGGVFVVRCERAAFQLWRVPTSFARPGDVTLVNAGDLAKELGIIPPTAAEPTFVAEQVVAPPGAPLVVAPGTIAAVRETATAALPALVRVDVTVPGGSGIGSGIVLDGRGDVLTAEHVVDSAQGILVTFANGAALPARVVGVDVANDIAVIQVPVARIGSGIKVARFQAGTNLAAGTPLVALGYTPYFASPPTTRLAIFQRVDGSSTDLLRTDSFILPGDSGGMLVDLGGHVIGVIDAIRFTHVARQPLISFSIEAGSATGIAQRILQGGGMPAAYLGLQMMNDSSEVAVALGLAASQGALVVGITPGGPADRTGVTVGDVVVAVDGRAVTSVGDVVSLVQHHSPGDRLSLTVVGGNGGRRTGVVVLAPWPGAGT